MLRSTFALWCCIVLIMGAATLDGAVAKKRRAKKKKAKGPGKPKGPIIGIDLGTTYSCVAIYRNDKVEVIPNELGNRVTPSWVAFTDTERLVGEAAKNQVQNNPANTVFDAKRLMGKAFGDVKRDLKFFPFSVVNRGDKPAISVKFKGKKMTLSPEEISAAVLERLKNAAEAYLGVKVRDAVITVPAYFSDGQRTATRSAGEIAGLTVRRIINEPTAAAVAYGLDKKRDGDSRNMVNVLVFDLGGGTFDVTLLTIDNGVFEVLATSGDTHLGGEDFDRALMNHFVREHRKRQGYDIPDKLSAKQRKLQQQKGTGNKKRNSKRGKKKGKPPALDKRAVQRLRKAVVEAKHQLSTRHEATLEVDALWPSDGTGDNDFRATLTRAKFESVCGDLFAKTLKPVEQVLRDSGLRKGDVDEVVLVGGSTRIPKVRALLSKFFNGKPLNHEVNPDEAVAYGAAVQAGILAGHSFQVATTGAGGKQQNDLVLLDVTPLSLGIETTGGIFSKIIPRNTIIPTQKAKTYTTEKDNQPNIAVTVFQGERELTKHNIKLGAFSIPVPPAPRGVPQVEVQMTLDANGILNVRATDLVTKKRKVVTITGGKGRFTEAELNRMRRTAKKFRDADREVKEAIEARNKFEQLVYDVRRQLRNLGDENDEDAYDTLDDDERKDLETALNESEEWLEEHKPGSKFNKEDVEAAQGELEDVWNPIVQRMYGSQGGGGDGDSGGDEGGGGGGDDDFFEEPDEDDDWMDEHDEL